MKSFTTVELIKTYMDELSLTATASTLGSYWDRFSHFSNYVKDSPVTRDKITGWLRSMIDAGRSASTIKAYRSTVRAMYLWAEDAEFITTNPVPRRFRLEIPAKEKIPIREADHAKILTQCHKEKYLFWYRACRIAWETGLRLSDIACLRVDQVNFVNGYIDIVPAKTKRFGKRLQIPISNHLNNQMIEWAENSSWILQEMKEWHDATGHRALSVMFGRIAKRAGLSGISFHSYRWGFVTRLIEKNVTVEVISQLTGQSYNQVMGYCKIDMETKRRALA